MESDEFKRTISLIDEERVNVDLIISLFRWFDTEGLQNQDNGAIFIFLPGAAEISAVIRKLSTGPSSRNFMVFPQHSLLAHDQKSTVSARAPKEKYVAETVAKVWEMRVEDGDSVRNRHETDTDGGLG